MAVMDQVVAVLSGLKQRFPTYSVVINGHSLGAAKAMLTGAYLTKFHSKDIPVAAVYATAQPPAGNTEFNQWLADCIGPEKVVRVVSSNDIVPYARASSTVQHAANVIEVFNPDTSKNEWRRCMGPLDPKCSAGVPCQSRSWKDHMRMGGIYMGAKICNIFDL